MVLAILLWLTFGFWGLVVLFVLGVLAEHAVKLQGRPQIEPFRGLTLEECAKRLEDKITHEKWVFAMRMERGDI